MMRALLLAGLLLAGPALAQAPARPPAPAPAPAAVPDRPMGLRLETVVQLRDPGGRWGNPVVDDANRRLYLPRGVAGLGVLALDGFKPLAEIADTAGSAAVALDPETLRGFSANALETRPGGPLASGITVFDQRGFKPVGSVPLAGVRHILYDAATKQVVAAGDGGIVSLIDPVKLTVTASIELDGKAVTALAADRRGRAFVALADRHAIGVLDLVARRVATTWKPEGCRLPVSAVFDSFAQRLVLACRGGAAEGANPATGPAGMMLDPFTGKPFSSFLVPALVESVIQDPVGRLLYFVSGGSASALVYRQLDPLRFEPLETAGTRAFAGMGAADGRTGRLILASAEYVATTARPDAGGGGLRILANSFSLLVMKRLPLE